ncbi:MAG: LytR C-terminal domain-containing protein [Actinomycetota bacterium]
MNLSPARLAVLVALVVGGLAVLVNGFGGDQAVTAGGSDGSPTQTSDGSTTPTESGSPSPSESPAPQLEPQVEDVVIQVLNGTSETGLAGTVEQFLVGKGYVAGLPAGDLDNKPAGTTIVYFRTGADADQNEVDAEHLAQRFLKGVEADVRPLNATLGPDIAPRTQLVVVVGTDYADAQATA